MQIKNPSLVKEMQKIGLSDKESLVYVSLLELGGAYPSKIAEYAGIKRATAYNILVTLSVRGLVNEIEKRNKIFYQIDRPNKLIQFSNNRVQSAQDSLVRAEKVLPDLESIFSLLGDKPKVLFFEGVDTVDNIYKDIISGAGNFEMSGFSNVDKFKNAMSPSQLKSYVKTKERLNITTKAIFPETPANRSYGQMVFAGIKKEYWPKARYAPAERFPYEAEIMVYGTNKLGILKFGGQNVIGVIIEDKMIHDMMKMIFELSWESPSVKD